MSQPMKRKAPGSKPVSRANVKAAPKKAAVNKRTALPTGQKDEFDSSDDDGSSSSSDDEFGAAIVEAIKPQYADYQKDITKVSLIAASSSSSDSDSDSDSDNDMTDGLTVNKDYAKKYEERKAKTALNADNQRFVENIMKKAQRLQDEDARREKKRQKRARRQERAKELEAQGLDHVEGMTESDDSTSESEVEDETGALMTPKADVEFFNVLHKLKSKDPSLYDKKAVFYTKSNADGDDEDNTMSDKKTKAQDGNKKITFQTYMRGLADQDAELDAAMDDEATQFENFQQTGTYHQGPLSGSVETLGEYEARQKAIKADFLKQLSLQEEELKKARELKKQKLNTTTTTKADNRKVSLFDAIDHSSGEEEDDGDVDDLFGAPKIIYDPNAEDDSSDSGDDDVDDLLNDKLDNELAEGGRGVRRQIDLYSVSKKLVKNDLAEAEKVVERLKKQMAMPHRENDAVMEDGDDITVPVVSATTNNKKNTTAPGATRYATLGEAERDQFLTKYILGGWWKSEAEKTEEERQLSLPQSQEMFQKHKSLLLKTNMAQNDQDFEDEVVVQANALYEHQLNFRYEDDVEKYFEDTSGTVMSYPRSHLIEDSMRQVVGKKKSKRERQHEKQRLEAQRQKELAKRMQGEANKLLNQKLKAITQLSGDFDLGSDEEGGATQHWTTADLLTEFDPAEHDKRNKEIYGAGTKADEKYKVAKDSDFSQSDDDSSESDSSSSNSSSGDDDGSSDVADSDIDINAPKAIKGDVKQVQEKLEAEYQNKRMEIQKRLESVQAEAKEIREKLPTLLKQRIREQLQKEREAEAAGKKKKVKNFSSSSDDDDSSSSSDDSDSDDDLSEQELPLDLKELDRLEEQEKLITERLEKQALEQHISIIKTVNNVFDKDDAEEEALSWWAQQRNRILTDPQYKDRLDAAQSKPDKQKVLRQILREELEQLDDAPAVVDLAKEQKRLNNATEAPAEDYSKVPKKAVANNPLLGGFRFQYITVPKADFGLSFEDIMESTDKELNSKVSIKKYFPYREDNNDTRHWTDIQYEQQQKFKKYMEEHPGEYQNGKKSKTGAQHAADFDDVLDNDLANTSKKHGAKDQRDWKSRHTANWSTATNNNNNNNRKNGGSSGGDKYSNYQKRHGTAPPTAAPAAAAPPQKQQPKKPADNKEQLQAMINARKTGWLGDAVKGMNKKIVFDD